MSIKVIILNRFPDTRPTGKKYEGRDVYELQEDFLCIIDGKPLTIQTGFLTDYGSIPRGLWNIFPPTDQSYAAATILHDYLYATKYFPRAVCDEIFLAALKSLGIGKIKCHVMWLGPRLRGGVSWNKAKDCKIFAARESAGIFDKQIPLYLYDEWISGW